MYSRPKSGSVVPSDAQAKEKLALYVYEYLLHVGAQKAAQTFLSEIRWDKSITLGESPGFLHSWWCVFWDLYCAAPERRDNSEHSTEAKVFHEYGFVQNTSGGPGGPPPFGPPNGYMPNAPPGGLPPGAMGGPQDGPMPGGPPFPFHPGMGPGQPMPGGPGGMGNCLEPRGPPGGPQGPNQGPPPGMMQHGGPPGPPMGPGGMGHQRLTHTPPSQMGPGRMMVNAGPPNGPPGGPTPFGGPYGGGVNCSPLPPGAANMSPLPTGGPSGRGPGGQQYSSASPVTFAGGPGTPGQGGPGMGPGSQDGDYMAMRHGLPPGMQAGQGGPQQGGPGSMAFMGPGGPDGGMMMSSEMSHIINGMDPQLESMKQSPRHPIMGGGPGSRGDDPTGGMYQGMYSELQSMQALASMQPPNAANGGQQQATVHHLN